MELIHYYNLNVYNYLSFQTTFMAHQTFATLSSNTPRATGKRRCSTPSAALEDPSHGDHKTAKVDNTIAAIRESLDAKAPILKKKQYI